MGFMDIASGIGGIAGATSNIAGGLLANTRQKQQYQNQVDLMGIQQKNQKELNLQGQQIAQENWDYSNAENQVKHYENAGLNVGLMYGGSGQGGQMTSASGGSAASGQAPMPENGAGQIGMGIQQSVLTMQQLDNMKADAELKRAQANEINKKLPGGLENQGLQNENIKWDNKNKDLDNQLKTRTLEDIITTAGANRNKAIGEAKSALTQGNINEATYEQQVNKASLDNALLIAHKQAIDAGIKLTEQETKEIEKELEYFKQKFDLDTRRVGAQEAYNKNLKEFQDSLIKQGYWKMGAEAVTNVAKMIMNPTGTATETISEGMKDKEGGYWNKTTTKKK